MNRLLLFPLLLITCSCSRPTFSVQVLDDATGQLLPGVAVTALNGSEPEFLGPLAPAHMQGTTFGHTDSQGWIRELPLRADGTYRFTKPGYRTRRLVVYKDSVCVFEVPPPPLPTTFPASPYSILAEQAMREALMELVKGAEVARLPVQPEGSVMMRLPPEPVPPLTVMDILMAAVVEQQVHALDLSDAEFEAGAAEFDRRFRTMRSMLPPGDQPPRPIEVLRQMRQARRTATAPAVTRPASSPHTEAD